MTWCELFAAKVDSCQPKIVCTELHGRATHPSWATMRPVERPATSLRVAEHYWRLGLTAVRPLSTSSSALSGRRRVGPSSSAQQRPRGLDRQLDQTKRIHHALAGAQSKAGITKMPLELIVGDTSAQTRAAAAAAAAEKAAAEAQQAAEAALAAEAASAAAVFRLQSMRQTITIMSIMKAAGAEAVKARQTAAAKAAKAAKAEANAEQAAAAICRFGSAKNFVSNMMVFNQPNQKLSRQTSHALMVDAGGSWFKAGDIAVAEPEDEFDLMDTDHDGRVTRQEWLAFKEMQTAERAAEKSALAAEQSTPNQAEQRRLQEPAKKAEQEAEKAALTLAAEKVKLVMLVAQRMAGITEPDTVAQARPRDELCDRVVRKSQFPEEVAEVSCEVPSIATPRKEPCPACGGAAWLPHDDDCPVKDTLDGVTQSLRRSKLKVSRPK